MPVGLTLLRSARCNGDGDWAMDPSSALMRCRDGWFASLLSLRALLMLLIVAAAAGWLAWVPLHAYSAATRGAHAGELASVEEAARHHAFVDRAHAEAALGVSDEWTALELHLWAPYRRRAVWQRAADHLEKAALMCTYCLLQRGGDRLHAEAALAVGGEADAHGPAQ